MTRRLLVVASVLAALLYVGSARPHAQGTLPFTSLASYIADLKTHIPGSGTNAFITPPQADLDVFTAAMAKLFAGDAAGANTAMNPLGYDVYFLNDQIYGKTYLVAEERQTTFRGQGTYIVDPAGFARNIVIEGPHPLYDINTENESQKIFQEIGGRALYIGGTHRCANLNQASSCSGTTSACDGQTEAYRISDAPHFKQNFMYAAHAASLNLTPTPKSFNVHGNASSSVDVELSDGTRNDEPSTTDVNRLRDALLTRGVSVGSCNIATDRNGFSLNLCGTDNTEGRLSNNSPEACGTAATVASGLFLHMEQHLNIRDNPTTLIDALKAVFPVDGTPTVPPAPTGLAASAGNALVTLTWNASSGATSYNVKRSTVSGGPYGTLATGVTSPTYTDAGLTNGTTYYYVVSAVNRVGESGDSNQASATPQAPTPPPVPTGLTATAGKKRVSLHWNTSAGATSYNVKRSLTSGGPYTTIATGVTATSYNNTGLNGGTNYCYVVSAVNASGESGNSNQACATAR